MSYKDRMPGIKEEAFEKNTSTYALQGINYFPEQLSIMDEGNEDGEYSGFWGHVGVLMNGTNEYKWYPITRNTQEYIKYDTSRNQGNIVIPCMNNIALFCNSANIKNIILLDDACDPPAGLNWDSSVDEGNIPLAFYEILDEYAIGCYILSDKEEKHFSDSMIKKIEKFISMNKYDNEDIYEMTNYSTVYYNDNSIWHTQIDLLESDELINSIMDAYETTIDTNLLQSDKILIYDEQEMASLLNMKNVSIIEIPLIKLEEAIKKYREENQEEYSEEYLEE